MIGKIKVKENFSRYAKYYDFYCNVQKLSAKKLIEYIPQEFPKRILDIGCGTGNYTKMLREKFPFAKIKAIDISKEMIEIAREKLKDKNIEFWVGDGERFNFDSHYDLITSNVCFQWFEDLELALTLYNKLLSTQGWVLFSIFGPLTFQELSSSLRELLETDDVSILADRFKDKQFIKDIMGKIFSDVEVEERIYEERYSSLFQLLKSIRYTSAKGGNLPRNIFWTPAMLSKLETVYRKKFNDVMATYQVFFCKGMRR
ncbi:MAG: malonyl-[acyl-carrier protein] O-methyltransferase BioC [Candidatus Omnitrophica bacterium 4484_70.1]|nr:MAG: malonyl-[acyl-carrier protein] O-methyltransferase BioC [Candidatus Omnitrophica bacterium 4484_70.1]